jgi:hypothetical protein
MLVKGDERTATPFELEGVQFVDLRTTFDKIQPMVDIICRDVGKVSRAAQLRERARNAAQQELGAEERQKQEAERKKREEAARLAKLKEEEKRRLQAEQKRKQVATRPSFGDLATGVGGVVVATLAMPVAAYLTPLETQGGTRSKRGNKVTDPILRGIGAILPFLPVLIAILGITIFNVGAGRTYGIFNCSVRNIDYNTSIERLQRLCGDSIQRDNTRQIDYIPIYISGGLLALAVITAAYTAREIEVNTLGTVIKGAAFIGAFVVLGLIIQITAWLAAGVYPDAERINNSSYNYAADYLNWFVGFILPLLVTTTLNLVLNRIFQNSLTAGLNWLLLLTLLLSGIGFFVPSHGATATAREYTLLLLPTTLLLIFYARHAIKVTYEEGRTTQSGIICAILNGGAHLFLIYIFWLGGWQQFAGF